MVKSMPTTIATKTFTANGRAYRAPDRPVLAICADGWDPEYLDDALERGLMPRLAEALDAGGTYAPGRAQMPTFTNPNNVAIVTGVSAARNGVGGNHYRAADGAEVQVTDPSFLRADTIHAVARAADVPALCVTAKDKLRRLLACGGVPAFSAELAHEQALDDGTPLVEAVGAPNPGIYDWELSPYTIDLALALAPRLGARLVYASLTDYVQHKAPPGSELADRFHRAMDERIGAALDAGFVVGLAADHGMKAKTRPDGSPDVRFLDDVLDAAGVSGHHTLLPITDPYVVHHAALGSLAWVHLDDPDQLDRARGAIAALPGVEAVLDRAAAAQTYELPADRIGDLVVLGGASTVFGHSAARQDLSAVGTTLRSHGGLHEQVVPIVICQPLREGALDGRDLRNRDLHDLLLNEVA
jgi:phosphonoacetate hydrolase